MSKPFTIDFDTLKEMFQLDNPELYLDTDLEIEDHQIELYHIILSGIKSSITPHFDVHHSEVKSFRVYAGESEKLQSTAFIDFELPSTEDGQTPQRHLAMILYSLGPHATSPDKLGINVSFAMHGKLENSGTENSGIEFIPSEIKCRQAIGKMSNLVPVDVRFSNNVKGAICYADAIFRCFLDGQDIDYLEIQDWLNMESFNIVSCRYDDLLQRSIGGLIDEITNDEDLDLRPFEGQIVFSEPAMKQ